MEYVVNGETHKVVEGDMGGYQRYAQKGVIGETLSEDIEVDKDSPTTTASKLKLEKEAAKIEQAEKAAHILKLQRREKADKAKVKRVSAQKKVREDAMNALRASVKANKQ
jgi:hypothetical protein